MNPEIDVKSIGNRGRKMDAQNNEKTSKMESTRQQKSKEIFKKTGQQINAKEKY